jgi:hypothetical protein
MNKYLNFGEFETLNEIGEGTAKPFKWKLEVKASDYINYITKSNLSGLEYDILFRKDHQDVYNLEYSVHYDSYTPGSFKEETNVGDMFSLMSTIIEIVKSFVKEFNPSEINFSGSPNKHEKEYQKDLNQRNKLYLAFIEKNLKKYFPDAELNVYRRNMISIKFR